MKIFIDFDDVLFNTKKFVKDFKNIFKKNGISEDIFQRCYYEKFKLKNRIQKYDPQKHLKRIGTEYPGDLKKIAEEIKNISFYSKKYIFRDTINFLKKLAKNEIFLISYSETKFQKDKIKNSKIEKYFKKIILTNKAKVHSLRKIIGGGKKQKNEAMFFIDDRAEYMADIKKNYPAICTILLQRKEGRYLNKKNRYCDFLAKNLQETLKIIKTKNGN